MADHQSSTYTIFCVVIDENIPFPVNVQPHTTVGELKKAIKAETQMFATVDAHKLTLYPVKIPDDDDLVKNVKKELNNQPLLNALRPTTELSTLFSETPAKGTVHILIRGPEAGK